MPKLPELPDLNTRGGFDIVEMIRALYAFVKQLAELVETLQEELAKLKTAKAK